MSDWDVEPLLLLLPLSLEEARGAASEEDVVVGASVVVAGACSVVSGTSVVVGGWLGSLVVEAGSKKVDEVVSGVKEVNSEVDVVLEATGIKAAGEDEGSDATDEDSTRMEEEEEEEEGVEVERMEDVVVSEVADDVEVLTAPSVDETTLILQRQVMKGSYSRL